MEYKQEDQQSQKETVTNDKNKAKLDEIKSRMQMCMVTKQLQYFIGGLLVGIPISIYKKSMYPFTITAVLGSFVDMTYPYNRDCIAIKKELDAAMEHIKS